MIKRDGYLQKINKELGDKEKILFLIGARQVGKTTLLRSLFEFGYIKKSDAIEVSGDKISTIGFMSSDDFLAYLRMDYDLTKTKYIIIDEAQYITNIGIILKTLIDDVRNKKRNWKIIVSGSGSLNIFKGITDSLIGRKKIIQIFPFNFEEFCISKGILDHKISPVTISKFQLLFHEFIHYGGYPKVVLSTNPIEKKEILSGLINDYIFKDVILFLKENDIVSFKSILRNLATHVCSMSSVGSIAKSLGITRYHLERFFFVLENTFLINQVHSFFGGKTNGEIKKFSKFYFNDLGILKFLLGLTDREGTFKGKVVENFVANELLIRKKEYENIYFRHTKSGAEVDFVIKDEIDGRITPIETKSSNQLNVGKSLFSFCDFYGEKIKNIYITTENQRKNSIFKNGINLSYLPYLDIDNINTISHKSH